MRRRPWRVAVLAAAMLAVGACGSGSDPPPESGTGPTGSGVTISESTTVSTTATGGPAPSTTSGAESELTLSPGAPLDFPEDFPQPDDAEIVVGAATIVRDDRVLSLDLTTDAELADVVAFYRSAIDDLGFVALFDSVDQQGRPPSANLRFDTGEYVGDVLLNSTDDETTVALTATMPLD